MERLDIKGGGKRKLFNNKKHRRASSIKSKRKASQKIQREISCLKAKCKELKEKSITGKEADKP